MADDFLKSLTEGIKYFSKRKAGKEPTFEKMEEAIGVEKTPPPPTPNPPPKEKPADKQSSLLGKSIMGSGKMSKEELKQGYRKVGVKLDYSEDGRE